MIGRLAYLLVLAGGLFGCGALTDRSYALDRGDANYDALKAASATCAARGGVIRLRKDYDGRDLSDYDCLIGKTR
jgi:hypothetical protein